MKKNLITIMTLLVLVLAGSQVTASGIELQEQDAGALGRALAVRAMLLRPSAVFFNPAGLSYLSGTDLSLGDTLVFPNFAYTDPTGVNADATSVNKLVAPPHAYVSHAFKIHGSGNLGIGLGFNYPFGLTLKWPDDFAGRHLVAESALQIPQIMAGVAYSPLKQVSFGATFVASPTTVYLKKYLGSKFGLMDDTGTPITDAFVEMKGSGWGFGFNLGIQARPTDWLYLGFVYRAAMSLALTGDAHFDLPGLSDKSGFPDQAVEAAFELPHIFAFGVGLKFGRWYGEFDVDYTMWSVFETIPLTFPDDMTGQLSHEIPEYWKNTWTIRLGNEITVLDNLKLQLGGGYDQNPATAKDLSPMLPDSDRLFASLGIGYAFDFGLRINAAYMFTYFLERTVEGHACTESDASCLDANGDLVAYDDDGNLNWVGNVFPATYNSHAQLVAITLGWHF